MGCCKGSQKMGHSVYDPQGTGSIDSLGEKSSNGFCSEEVSQSHVLPSYLNGSHGPRAASAGGEDPMDMQHTPSGDSFRTCISQESIMRRRHEESAARGSTKNRCGSASSALRVHFALPPPSSCSSDNAPHPGPSPTSISTAESGNTLSTIPSSLSGREDMSPQTTKSAPAVMRVSGSQECEPGQQSLTSIQSEASNTGKMRRSMTDRVRKSFSVSMALKRMSRRDAPAGGRQTRRKSLIPGYYKDRQNPNMPSEYSWTEELLEMIIKNETCDIGSLDRSSPQAQATSPLFVVCGACPSSFAPMQAILYSAVGSSCTIDFWWTKPLQADPSALERQTLDRNAKGPHKNDPGRSKSIYKPLGDLFSGNTGKVKQEFSFGLETVSSTQRAYIEDPRRAPPSRYYLYFVWQEEWTSNPFSSDKFIKGKIAYQREPLQGLEAAVFLREYCIQNGRMSLADEEEEVPPNTILPNSACKELGALKK